MWLTLEAVSLDSCRYVTDFGLELLSYASGKPKLINELPNGCERIFKYAYDEFRLDNSYRDLFSFPNKLNKLITTQKDKEAPINSFKVLIINKTNWKFSNLNDKETNPMPNLISYNKLNFPTSSSKQPITLNIFEIDSNFPCFLNTPSSVLVLCFEFKDISHLVEDLINKFLQLFYKVYLYSY